MSSDEPHVIPLHTGSYKITIERHRHSGKTKINITRLEDEHCDAHRVSTLIIENRTGTIEHHTTINCRHPDIGIAFMVTEDE
jgi:hypothetical protein